MERNLICNLINEELIFDEDSLAEVARQVNTHALPVVAIIGSTSSGKSSFLNSAFELDLPVMNPNVPMQITKGIQLIKPTNRDIMLLDSEGYDAIERYQSGQINAGDMLVLFTLCISDVIIVNIYAKDVNRGRGSFYDLLSIIIETYIKKVKDGKKRTVLFLLRDFNGDLTEYRHKIKTTFDSLWRDKQESQIPCSNCFELKTCKLFWSSDKRTHSGEDIETVTQEILNSTQERVFPMKYSLLIRHGSDIWDSIMHTRENLNIENFYNQLNEELRIIEEEAEKVLINQAEQENRRQNPELEEEGKEEEEHQENRPQGRFYKAGQFIPGGGRAPRHGIYK